MGIRKGGRTFAADVLRIEVSGPDQEHFSVVDVPGMLRKTTEGVTTDSDPAMIREIVESYMNNPRSIMLAVVPSNVDVATQEILDIAKLVDDEGSRTIRVLTKPDLVDPGSENSVMDLVKGRKHRLALGWCIVKNPGQKQTIRRHSDRHAQEKAFFEKQAPWHQLEKDEVGITALRSRLQELLAECIRSTFPAVSWVFSLVYRRY